MTLGSWSLDALTESVCERASQLGFYFLVMLIKVKPEAEKS